MKEPILSRWCDQAWLVCEYLLGAFMLSGLILNWNRLSGAGRLMGLLAVLLPFHVFEENTYPGGFFYVNNMGQHSEDPMVYPQNRLTNMWTNLGAEIVFIILALRTDALPGAAATLVTFFGIGECVHHTRDGFRTLRLYHSQGKKTIYTPGLFTSYVGLIELSIGGIWWILRNPYHLTDLVSGLLIVVGIIVIGILIPFAISSKIRSKTYAFGSRGYYEKFQ